MTILFGSFHFVIVPFYTFQVGMLIFFSLPTIFLKRRHMPTALNRIESRAWRASQIISKLSHFLHNKLRIAFFLSLLSLNWIPLLCLLTSSTQTFFFCSVQKKTTETMNNRIRIHIVTNYLRSTAVEKREEKITRTNG